MDKLVARVKRAERTVGKRAARAKREEEGANAWNTRQQRRRLLEANAKVHQQARKTWQTNWETGSLAPRLDVADQVESYGTSSIYNSNNPNRQVKSRPKWIPIEKGDRVVVTYGPDRGKISYVLEVRKDSHSVVVGSLNKEELYVPDWALREARDRQPDAPALQEIQHPLPIEHVRLVYPLPDSKTGAPRDVIIDRLEKVGLYRDKAERQARKDDPDARDDFRAIAGSDMIIPWPEQPAKKDEEVFDNDTPRIIVDEISFRPYLLTPPMPTSVIDELRNKYSRFRTRNTPEFEQKIEARVEREERRNNLSKTMRTPLQELAELRARQKAAEVRVLTDDQLAKIGEVMAQGRRSSARVSAAQ